MGELTLSHHSEQQVPIYVQNHDAAPGQFHLRYDGKSGVSLSSNPTLINVNLVRNTGTAALTGNYLVQLLPRDDSHTAADIFVSDGLQQIPFTGCASLNPVTL